MIIGFANRWRKFDGHWIEKIFRQKKVFFISKDKLLSKKHFKNFFGIHDKPLTSNQRF